jgi:hypothetical protein
MGEVVLGNGSLQRDNIGAPHSPGPAIAPRASRRSSSKKRDDFAVFCSLRIYRKVVAGHVSMAEGLELCGDKVDQGNIVSRDAKEPHFAACPRDSRGIQAAC